jgi:hypothetical protein
MIENQGDLILGKVKKVIEVMVNDKNYINSIAGILTMEQQGDIYRITNR